MSFTIRYFGTNTILIQDDNTHILVDPHFTRPSKLTMLGKIAPDPQVIYQAMLDFSIEQVDAILITHSHYDHALDAVEAAKQRQAIIYGSASMGMLSHSAGLPPAQFRLLQPDEEIQIGDFKVSAFAATHLKFPGPFADWLHLNGKIENPILPPAWFWQYRAGQVHAFLLKHTQSSLLLNGSAGLFTTTNDLSADAAVLCIGGMGWKSMSEIQNWYQQMVLQTGIRRLYLAHYDDFTAPFKVPLKWIPGTKRAVRRIKRLADSNPDLHVQTIPFNKLIHL